MKENKMYEKLKKVVNTYGKVYSIETGGTSKGIPDVFFVLNDNTSGWIELKQSKINKNGTFRIQYRAGQKVFLTLCSDAETKSFVLLYLEGTFYLIYKNFKKDFFLSIEDLLQDCAWNGKKLNKNLVDALSWARR